MKDRVVIGKIKPDGIVKTNLSDKIELIVNYNTLKSTEKKQEASKQLFCISKTAPALLKMHTSSDNWVFGVKLFISIGFL